MFAPADYVLRPLKGDDEVVLWEMLYQALSPPDSEAPSREIMQRPEYARYVEGWGRPGDTGYVVHGGAPALHDTCRTSRSVRLRNSIATRAAIVKISLVMWVALTLE